MVQDSDDLHAKARTELAQDVTDSVPVFSQVKAEYLLIISALVYTRDSTIFREAEKRYREMVAQDGIPLPVRPILSQNIAWFRMIQSMFERSDAVLEKNARSLGLQISIISELDSGYGGPCASLLWNRDDKSKDQFLIVAVKGTGLLDVNEWLIDAAIQKARLDRCML